MPVLVSDVKGDLPRSKFLFLVFLQLENRHDTPRRGTSTSNRQATQDFSSFPRVYPRKLAKRVRKLTAAFSFLFSLFPKFSHATSFYHPSRAIPLATSFAFDYARLFLNVFTGKRLFISTLDASDPLRVCVPWIFSYLCYQTKDKNNYLQTYISETDIVLRSSNGISSRLLYQATTYILNLE